MRKKLLVTGLLVAFAGSVAATPPQPPHPDKAQTLARLTARIEALESNAQALKAQAAAALAAARQARDELEQMKAEQKQNKLAERLAAISRKAPPAQSSGMATGNDFNPAIAVILNGRYTHHSLDHGDYVVAGFPPAGEAGPLPQGLSLGESEIALSANVDDKFYGQLTVTAHSEDGHDHVGVEEAFIDTTALPAGLGMRMGRFYSDIGYLNSHHPHTDFFAVRPLVYQAFLGNQYGDDGVRVQWVAPTNTFIQLGGEAFRGQNYPAAGAGNNGIGAHTLFVHTGGDVGASNAWFAGLSMLRARARNGDDGFSGRDTLYIADATWKWSHHGNFKDGGLLLRGEYMRDKRDGHYTAADTGVAATDPATLLLAQPWLGHRQGLYLEGVYNFNRTWSTGYRYDKLWASNTGPFASAFDPFKHSVMLTWRNSEFSLLRLQYSREKPDSQHSDNALVLQYQVAIGAHGAHKF